MISTKHKLYIIIASLLCVLNTGAFSQNNLTENKLESSFTGTTLSEADVRAFETRGIQKLRDFYNYLAIICNSQYEITLRQAAKKQALDLFFNPDCSVNNKPVEKMLDSCLNLKQNITWQISSLNTREKLTMETVNVLYKGLIEYKISNGGGVGQDKTVTILLCKRDKKFGDEIEQVWTVLICDIR